MTDRQIIRNKPTKGTNTKTVTRPAQQTQFNSVTDRGRPITTVPSLLKPQQRVNVPQQVRNTTDDTQARPSSQSHPGQ